MLLYWGWRILGPLTRALPLSLAYWLARRLMDAVFLAWPRGRRAMRANLAVVLGTHNRRTLNRWARRQWRRYGEYLVDALRLDAASPADCAAALRADPVQWERLRAAHGTRPILFAVMHFGNWDVGGGAYAHTCGRSAVLVESLGHPALDRAIFAARDRLGMTPIPMASGARAALRHLRGPGTLAVLFDRPLPPDEPGVDVTFFGAPCRVPAGMARLALSTNAWVIPLAVARRAPGRFAFQGQVALDLRWTSTGDRSRDARALTQAVLDVYEAWVRDTPDQWYQFRPFFR